MSKNKFIKVSEQLPPIGVVVEAVAIYKPYIGSQEVVKETTLLRRINVKDTNKGWQWSDHEINTYYTRDVIKWRFLSSDE